MTEIPVSLVRMSRWRELLDVLRTPWWRVRVSLSLRRRRPAVVTAEFRRQ